MERTFLAKNSLKCWVIFLGRFLRMRVSDYHFDLPDSLIATYPTPDRTSSRLLKLDGPTGELTHLQFSNVLDLVQPGDLMVFNNTRVIPARVFGEKESGGKIEILIERIINETEAWYQAFSRSR